jgi:uncharacterized protein
MTIEFLISFLFLGALVGFMAGLLGIGGGGIMVPILTSIFLAKGMPIDNVVHLALGTSMASIIVTSFSSMKAHNKNKNVLWNIVKSMSIGILTGTFLATFIASQISSIYLALFFALFMGYVSIQMFLNKKPSPNKKLANKKGLFFVGNGIGAISALVSIGGGSLTVPYLTWSNIELKKAIGTSAAIGLPISIAGTLGYIINGWNNTVMENYTFGFVYFPAVLLISATSYFSAPYGAKLANKLPVSKLKKIFALLLSILSIKMLITVMN